MENRLKVEILSVSKILRKNCPMSFLNRSLKTLRYLTRSGLSEQVIESMTQIFTNFYSKNVDLVVARTLFRSFKIYSSNVLVKEYRARGDI